MKTTALIEKNSQGKYSIYTPNIETTIVGEGDSVCSAKEDFDRSVKEMVASYVDAGDELPMELEDLTFDYRYDVASVFNYFDFINVSKFAKWAGINPGLMRQYKTKSTYISENQANKIEAALRKVGKELASVSL